MRTTLKYFAILASTAGAALISASCASDGPPTAPAKTDIAVAQSKLQDLHDKYDWIGQYHTDGLGYVYAQLTKGKPKSHADICRIAAKATKEFHKMARTGSVPAGLVDPSLNNEVCPDDFGSVGKTVIFSGTNPSPRSELSAAAMNLMDQIVNITSSSTSRYAYVTGVQNVEAQAVYLPSDEAGAVIAVGSVALSSVDYWEANLGNWVSIPTSLPAAYSLSALDMSGAMVSSVAAPTLAPRFAPWWQSSSARGFGRVLAADAGAAVRSAYISWMLGPIGVDAMVANALWASTAAAISLLF